MAMYTKILKTVPEKFNTIKSNFSKKEKAEIEDNER